MKCSCDHQNGKCLWILLVLAILLGAGVWMIYFGGDFSFTELQGSVMDLSAQEVFD